MAVKDIIDQRGLPTTCGSGFYRETPTVSAPSSHAGSTGSLVAREIFEPLGMNRTSITAVKGEYKQDLASGYEFAENKYQKLPFQWFHTYPASDVNSTATLTSATTGAKMAR